MHFKDRFQAGRFLAAELLDYKDRADVLVLALPRGGVPVGSEVAHALRAPLDVLVVRKIGVPGFPELAMGALAAGGVENISGSTVAHFRLSPAHLQKVIDDERKELQRREFRFRGNRPFPEVRGKVVILIDDGLATGHTMDAAITAVRRQGPQEVIIAVPVGARETCRLLTGGVNKVICLCTPAHFDAVGAFYLDFHQVTDDEVEALLRKACGDVADVSALS